MPQEAPDPDAEQPDAQQPDPHQPDAELSRHVDRLRAQVAEQGRRARDQRRQHAERAAASAERRTRP